MHEQREKEWQITENRVAFVERFHTFIWNICAPIYATSPRWKPPAARPDAGLFTLNPDNFNSIRPISFPSIRRRGVVCLLMEIHACMSFLCSLAGLSRSSVLGSFLFLRFRGIDIEHSRFSGIGWCIGQAFVRWWYFIAFMEFFFFIFFTGKIGIQYSYFVESLNRTLVVRVWFDFYITH